MSKADSPELKILAKTMLSEIPSDTMARLWHVGPSWGVDGVWEPASSGAPDSQEPTRPTVGDRGREGLYAAKPTLGRRAALGVGVKGPSGADQPSKGSGRVGAPGNGNTEEAAQWSWQEVPLEARGPGVYPRHPLLSQELCGRVTGEEP